MERWQLDALRLDRPVPLLHAHVNHPLGNGLRDTLRYERRNELRSALLAAERLILVHAAQGPAENRVACSAGLQRGCRFNGRRVDDDGRARGEDNGSAVDVVLERATPALAVHEHEPALCRRPIAHRAAEVEV
jgi:hypothetical protein